MMRRVRGLLLYQNNRLIKVCSSAVRTASTNSKPEFTSKRYKVDRGPYANLSDKDVTFFTSLLGQTRVITDPDDCYGYNVDWIKMVRGNSQLVLKPKTTEEVSTILRYCNDNKLAVCPQSGNTGLVGGSVPVFDEIVISMQLMNQIINVDELAGVIVCEAGCVLQSLDDRLQQAGLMMPIDLGAKGSCLIGGCVSTNAGGLRLLRYGNLHGNVLGVEAVQANGQVIDCLNTLKKDNTGYHMKHLFIGSEGTLGVVTKVAIQCPTLPKAVNVALLGLDSFANVLSTYNLARKELAEILSSCEFMDQYSIGLTVKYLGLTNPLLGGGAPYPFYMLIETAGSESAHDEAKINSFVEKAMGEELVLDGTMTSEPSKIKTIWGLRERIAEAVLHEGYVFKYDVSLPLPHFYQLVQILRDRFKDDSRVLTVSGFGHLGDGNLHIQVSIKQYDKEIEKMLEPFIFEYISKVRGSVSAEHGIGFKKTQYLHYSKHDSAIQLMRQIKTLMDPNTILNPYKVLHPLS